MPILLSHFLHLFPFLSFPPPFSLTSPVPSLYASFSFPFDLNSCAIIFFSSFCSLYFFVSVFPVFNLLLSPFTSSSSSFRTAFIRTISSLFLLF
jgi:hypothetical protein